MRDLSECKAEIFRLSEKRIKKRNKTRKSILSACATFLLFLGVGTAFLFGGGLLPKLTEVPITEVVNTEEETSDIKEDITPPPSSRPNNETPIPTPPPSADIPPTGVITDPNLNADPFEPSDYIFDFLDIFGKYDSFYFTYTWGENGENFYDSKTGVLIKDRFSEGAEERTVNFKLTQNDNSQIFFKVRQLGVRNYADIKNFEELGEGYESFETIIFTVETSKFQKSITLENIPENYESPSLKETRLLTVLAFIEEIITSSEEWKSVF